MFNIDEHYQKVNKMLNNASNNEIWAVELMTISGYMHMASVGTIDEPKILRQQAAIIRNVSDFSPENFEDSIKKLSKLEKGIDIEGITILTEGYETTKKDISFLIERIKNGKPVENEEATDFLYRLALPVPGTANPNFNFIEGREYYEALAISCESLAVYSEAVLKSKELTNLMATSIKINNIAKDYSFIENNLSFNNESQAVELLTVAGELQLKAQTTTGGIYDLPKLMEQQKRLFNAISIKVNEGLSLENTEIALKKSNTHPQILGSNEKLALFETYAKIENDIATYDFNAPSIKIIDDLDNFEKLLVLPQDGLGDPEIKKLSGAAYWSGLAEFAELHQKFYNAKLSFLKFSESIIEMSVQKNIEDKLELPGNFINKRLPKSKDGK